ncbi:hypothetical protein KBC55_03280 [Patescibacteria group bacterium]|nr:hypothetical protein [Patescibacteria group bacterium]
MRRLLFGLFTLLVAFFGAAQVSHALTISPTSADYSVLSGGIGEAIISLENETSVDREYEVQFVQVTFDSTTGAPAFSPLAGDVAAMFSADPASMTLRPSDTLDVTLRFAAPPQAESAEYTVAALFVERMSANAGVSVGAGYAVMLFAQIGTEGTQAYQIVQLETPKSVVTSLPVQLGAVLKNVGDRAVAPTATIQIRRPGKTQVIEEIPLNAYGQRLPVQTSRIFLSNWGDETDVISWRSLGNALSTPYGSFEAVIVDAQGDLVDSANPAIRFTVIPMHLMVIGAALISLLIFGILLARALHKRATA